MTSRPTSATREVLGGSVRVFLAEALILPTALVTAGFLTRRLGPSDFGTFTLATAIVAWIEWTLTALFARAAVKLVADADDWRPAGSVVLRIFAVSGLLGALALWIAAPSIAVLLHDPRLARALRILAFDIPLFTLSQAHLQILVGMGAYRSRAIVALWRSVRMVLVISLVLAGLSIDGALFGILGSTLIELVVARRFVQPPIRQATGIQTRALWEVALPLFVAAMSMRLFDKLDLFTLKALGATSALAGQYGAAQNLTIIPGLVALSVTSLLISTLTRSLRGGEQEDSRSLVRNTLRGLFLLLPFAALTAGTSTELSMLIFGREFAPSGPFLALLIFASIAVATVSTASAMLLAVGKVRWIVALAMPIPLVALLAQLVVIPRYGAIGAAAVTLAVAAAAGIAALVAIDVAWRVRPPLPTMLRSLLAGVAAYALAVAWRTTGIAVVLELAVLSVLIVALLVVLGELTPDERARLTSLVRRPPVAPAVPAEHS